MITNGQFSFIHVHKTGGRSLNAVIAQVLPDSQTVGYHYPLALLPDSQRHLPVVGVVRNPWDWYVSWYAFNRKMGMRNPLFIVLSDGGKADFRTTVRNMLNLGDDSARSCAFRAALAAILPKEFGSDRGSGLTRSCIESLNDPQRGYYSWLLERMLGKANSAQLHVARFENLQADFVAIMRKLGVAQADALDAALQTAERKNSSSHGHYSQYYDEETRALVGERERSLIEAYGYEFEAIESTGQTPELPAFYSFDVGFRKLLDRENNFLLISDTVDIAPLRAKVEQLSEKEWDSSGREEKFRAHRKTQSLILVSDDFKHLPPTYFPDYLRFEAELRPILQTIANFYGGEGALLRAILVRLAEGEVIDPHVDEGMSLLHCHRTHVPIITHPDVKFCVGGEKRHLAAGEIWEINNATVHFVENFSHHARVHLIVDWATPATLRHRERIAGITSTAPSKPLPSRNDPCPCGSGLRHKNCHGKLS